MSVEVYDMTRLLTAFLVIVFCPTAVIAEDVGTEAQREHEGIEAQYEHEDIVVARAWEDEPTLVSVSPEKALDYVERGAAAWARSFKCITCHTSGCYVRMRPLLTKSFGKPSQELHALCLDELSLFEEKLENEREWLLENDRPGRVAYTAMGLAEWDAQLAGKTSGATRRALKVLLDIQMDNGAWGNGNCWPPLESSSFHSTTVAAMAFATAPGWRENVCSPQTIERLGRTQKFLRETPPPHDYGRVLLLWASTRWPELLEPDRKQSIVDTIFSLQQQDGGWSIRRFAEPQQWGDGHREERLRGEPDFNSPASDGHMTGLAVISLIDAGIPPTDARIQCAVCWLKANQRESGRWWTRSLNTDSTHYITFSSTLYALVALAKSNAL